MSLKINIQKMFMSQIKNNTKIRTYLVFLFYGTSMFAQI